MQSGLLTTAVVFSSGYSDPAAFRCLVSFSAAVISIIISIMNL